jgi:flagellar basal-body rod modification protein FlgD
MQISGTSSSDPITSATSGDGKNALGKDSFMKLLAAQMSNQDPMAPTENSAMLAQLAQFSSLEQMQQLNDNIVGLAVLQQSNALMQQLTDSSALIGKSVEYIDPTTQAKQWGEVGSVRIVDGLAQLQIDGADVPLANVTEIGTPPVTEPPNTSGPAA